MADRNHVELDWAVESIRVGARHRKDLGDLEGLAASIREHGLLQPLTITDEGVLVCGARRLAAIKLLGWRVVNVWVRVDLSDRLSAVMAERDENIHHKQFSKIELADMYEELKAEIAADAARRQRSCQFDDSGQNPQSDGVANFATPYGEAIGDSRRQAAAMVGGASHTTLEKIAAIRQIAADTNRSDQVREQAQTALARIDAGEGIDSLFHQVRSAAVTNDLARTAADDSQPDEVRAQAQSGLVLLRSLADADMGPADLDKAARAAMDKVNTARMAKKPLARPKTVLPVAPKIRTVKYFVWTWNELKDWPSEYDPEQVAAGITDQEWEQFQQTMAAGVEFMNTVAELRSRH